MTKLVRAIYGPQRGLLSLEDADADTAIKAGWAVDPYTPYEIAPDFDIEKATKAAEEHHAKQQKAASAPVEKPAAAKKADVSDAKATETKAAEVKPAAETTSKAADDASYNTRVSKPKE